VGPQSIGHAIRYATSDDLSIAYHVFGDGPVDIVLVPGFISHIEFAWQEPLLARFLRKLSSFARVIAFDKRGMGLSDRNPHSETPTLDERCRDIAAVMRAAGSSQATLLAWSEGGPTALKFSADHPDAVEALVLVGTTPRFTSAEHFPHGLPRPVLELFVETVREEWGSGVAFELYAPSLADNARARGWWASYQRLAASPGAVSASLLLHLDVDVTRVLPATRVPALVIHDTYDMVVPIECARYLASHLPNATLLELDGEDHMYWTGNQGVKLDAIRQLVSTTERGASLSASPRKRGRAAWGWESLTESELDIARLVGAGMTNRVIAERLFISPRTVQTHLSHIMRKLELERRAEVSAEVARRNL
jgi:pimeloyl-ACP methyl ester carboxylesterase/DNA-binding CsgD family transcriptional regulator